MKGNAALQLRLSLLSADRRLWAKVYKTDFCWLWTGTKNNYGYGYLKVGGQRIMAHRLSYELSGGIVPKGFEIDHLCRVRHCVRPSHLEPVTRRENLIRGNTIPARHAVKTHCPRGHTYTDANLYVWRNQRHCRACRARRMVELKASLRLRSPS